MVNIDRNIFYICLFSGFKKNWKYREIYECIIWISRYESSKKKDLIWCFKMTQASIAVPDNIQVYGIESNAI